ncbi:MAG: hypothetical protein P8X42_00445 [Calditrichaceae bacterium]
MNKRFFHIYSIFNYIIFLILFIYFIGFVNGVLAPKSIDTGVTGSLSMALIINALLITLFGIQHSIMARPRFKT